MKKSLTKVTFTIAALVAMFIFIISSIVGGGVGSAYAATSTMSAFDKTNVMDDLVGSTIDGKKFNLIDWNFDETKETQVLSFVEFCYSYSSEKQDDFGLYVYIYNPKGLNYDYDSGLNSISMAYSPVFDDDSVEYLSYSLKYLNLSNLSGYEGLFLKYKVALSDDNREDIFTVLNSTERVYKIGEVQLLINGDFEPSAYPVGKTFIYSGYSKGYGSDFATEDTLSCSSYEITTLSPKVNHTFYRASGTNGTNTYTQDTLQSVYFSVPNNILNEYGELVEVRASWLKTMLQWGFVTGDKTYYDFVESLMGYDMSHGIANYGVGGYVSPVGLDKYSDMRIYAYTPLVNGTSVVDYGQTYKNYKDDYQGWFSGLYWAGAGTDSADSYIVSRDEILTKMKSYHDDYDTKEPFVHKVVNNSNIQGVLPTTDTFVYKTPYGGELLTVDGVTYPYSKALFQDYDDTVTIADISKDKIVVDGEELEVNITSQVLDKSFWEHFTHGYHVVDSTVFDGLEFLHEIVDSDFKATEKMTCDFLFIDESDYSAFKKFYDSAIESEETVFLLRFDVGEYSALETILGVTDENAYYEPPISEKSTNGYIFKQNCYLNFDFIHLAFKSGEERTVIPIVMSPLTIVNKGTPPINIISDKWANIIKLILGLLAFVLIIVVLGYFGISPAVIFKPIIWLITLPFKLIGKLFKKKE